MKLDHLKSAVYQVLGADVEFSALQVVMLSSGNAAEIKVRRADDGEFYQGIVYYDNPLRVKVL